MDEHADEDGEHADGTTAFGELGDPANADRTVEVKANDDLTFEPSSISIAEGETVTFSVRNTGQNPHEFVIGDVAFQEQHDQEMMEGGTMHMDANAVAVDPGETVELTWTFSHSMDDLEFGCHLPGHYAAGMVGDFTFN